MPGQPAPKRFVYDEAFDRNIGWLSAAEQSILRAKTVAIAGAGGVGGSHALTLARLGVGGFRIADPDVFELANFNRQAGARVSTLGEPKAKVIAAAVEDINPTARVQSYVAAITAANVAEFLDGVDLYVDGLDFFVPEARQLLFARCAELGIPAITAAPLGMSVAYLVFMPGGMTFERYFGMAGRAEQEQLLRFLMGLAPRMLHRRALADPSRVSLGGHRGPSTPMAVELCAGVVGVEAVKILTGRGKVYAAPWYHQFDPFSERWVRKRAWLGARNPLFRLKCWLGKRILSGMARSAAPRLEQHAKTDLERILELARWAPSGDNRQPWRFEIHGPHQVHVYVRPDYTDVYDLDGRPTLIGAGCLLETLRLAATREGRRMRWTHAGVEDGVHRIVVDLERDDTVSEDPLCTAIVARTVVRSPFRRRALTPAQKKALEDSVGPELEVRWFESFSARSRMTALNVGAAAIRLRSAETHRVHAEVIDFDDDYPATKMPAASLGMSFVSRFLARWAFARFSRMRWLMRLGGALVSHLELDVAPGLACAAHFALVRRGAPAATPEADLRAGEAFQRFWLRATQLGLVLQPSYTPLLFARYADTGVQFSADPRLLRRAAELSRAYAAAVGGVPCDGVVMLGRLGAPRSVRVVSRSLRLPLPELIYRAHDERSHEREREAAARLGPG